MNIRIPALLLGALLLLSSCGAGPAPEEGRVSSEAPVSVSEPAAIVPAYLGDWVVTSSPGTAPICTISPQEIADCLQLPISYGEDSFTTEGITCEFQPGTAYAEGIVTAEEFQAACQLSLEELGIEASMLLHVTVDIQGELGQNRLLGRDFFVLDSDSLLVYWDGVFFLAERAAEI